MENREILDMRNITKDFSGVKALNSITIKVKKGDVLLSTVRPNLEGFTIIRDEVKDLIASTGFAVITSKNELHNEYLFNFLFISSKTVKQLKHFILCRQCSYNYSG